MMASSNSGLEDFLDQWRFMAEHLRSLGADGQADTLAMCVRQLEGWMWSEESRLVTIAEAADIGGYSEEHLRRLVRAGSLPAVQNGPGGRIRLRARAVPMKATVDAERPDISPARVAGGTSDAYDPAEDARDIAQAIGGER